MPAIDLGQINVWAVVVAALATFMLGGMWYTALFGKLWLRLNAFTEAQLAEMKRRRPPPVFFGVMLMCYFVMATVMAMLMAYCGVTSVAGGVWIGFLIWVGIAAAIGLTGHIASDKPLGVFLIDASYQLIYLVMTGAIFGGWR